MNRDDLRQRAAVVRAVALDAVLTVCGAVRDRHDKSKWHTEQGPLSICGPKFMNWQSGQGGGGAIDLVMHLNHVDFRTAVTWLEHQLGLGQIAVGQSSTTHPARNQASVPAECRPLQLPARNERMLDRVRQYMEGRRYLRASLIEPLVESGRLYADRRGNAVFLLVAGTAHRPVGAELRGTGPQVWRGLAPGTRKDLGYFWVGAQGSPEIMLCESAIDAMSCFQLHPHRICISTSGIRAHPPWLGELIACGYTIHCGFDADGAGDAAARQMIASHPTVKRLRPPAHDWNDVLASGQ